MPSGTAQNGFRIFKPLELLNWRPIPIGREVQLEEQSRCPACNGELATLATLSGDSGGAAIRVGSCAACGYTGYRDRPSADWISRYYAEVWSHGAEKDVEELRGKRPPENPATATLRQALAILPDHNRPILEIGAGYGTMLRFVREAGFENVVGIESSRSRAETAAAATGLPMLAGDFESPAIQAELAARGLFGLIYLFHVLEHTYNPAAIVAGMSRLQLPGDYLVIGVPNLVGEPAMNILLFLPHLHSFTLRALAKLLGCAGYGIVEAGRSDGANLNIIARKGTAGGISPHMENPNINVKFERELTLTTLAPSGRQRYFWSKKDAALSGIEPYHWYWRIADSLYGRRNIRSLLVEPLAEPARPGPFVLSFVGDPFLCIK